MLGWSLCRSQDPAELNKAIRDDYQSYIQKLPPDEKKFVGGIHLFEDGTGQNAVRIEVNLNGTRWAHVLIYDKENNRVNLIKYASGKYKS